MAAVDEAMADALVLGVGFLMLRADGRVERVALADIEEHAAALRARLAGENNDARQ